MGCRLGRSATAQPRELSPEASERATLAWGRLVKRCLRVRAQQRIWAAIGHYLQTIPESLRLRLRILWPPASGKIPGAPARLVKWLQRPFGQ